MQTTQQTLADYLTNAPVALQGMILTLAQTGIAISELLKQGALAGIQGVAGGENIQGEQQQKLDVISNNMLLTALNKLPSCAGVASEELDDITPTTYTNADYTGDYLVLFDPLDGSSNIDINMSVGTIFSILPNPKHGTQHPVTEQDFLQAGNQQIAAGYILYGTATMLALTLGQGTALFSLDPNTQTFMLLNAQVSISADTQEYAINASNYRHWLQPMQQYIDNCVAGEDGVRGKNFNTRWVAAMVADVHRILCRGGIFMYPFDTKNPNKPGKLRLMYEANPMSLLIEQAGGMATDAINPILQLTPTHIHQRVPVVLGSKNEVLQVQALHQHNQV